MVTSRSCGFPLGCRNKTKDASGLCHHHRRFSALTWDANGRMTQPRRLSTTVAMMKQDPNYIRIYEAAQVAMDNRVYARELEPGVYTMEHVAGFPLPEVAGATWSTNQEDGSARLVFSDKPNGDEELKLQREMVQSARDQIRVESFAPKYGVYDVIAEEYDDDAEVISQLNVGRRLGGTSVTVFDGRNHSEYDMRVRVVPAKAIHGEHYDVAFKHDIMRDENTGEMYRGFKFVNVDGSMTASNNEEVMHNVFGVVINIDMYGVRVPNSGKVYMPVGWSDRPA